MSPEAIRALLAERMALSVDAELSRKLALYLDLLLRWNGRTNLTAIRRPEQIVVQHFGECLQCAEALPSEVNSLLDFGSGAGFPGVLCALARSEMSVTLAESQGKKAAFLAEVARQLAIGLTVHAGRVKELPARRKFDGVTLRAVDNMEAACMEALTRVKATGRVCLLTTHSAFVELRPKLGGLEWGVPVGVRSSEQRVIVLGRRIESGL